VYCATTNPGKLREFQMALQDSIQVQPLPGLASIAPCEETGVTFEQNAVQKALYYSKFCDGYLFVDDSGLEVDALQGAPGVYSARFAGPNATDTANNQLLLEKMRSVADREARFVCVVTARKFDTPAAIASESAIGAPASLSNETNFRSDVPVCAATAISSQRI